MQGFSKTQAQKKQPATYKKHPQNEKKQAQIRGKNARLATLRPLFFFFLMNTGFGRGIWVCRCVTTSLFSIFRDVPFYILETMVNLLSGLKSNWFWPVTIG